MEYVVGHMSAQKAKSSLSCYRRTLFCAALLALVFILSGSGAVGKTTISRCAESESGNVDEAAQTLRCGTLDLTHELTQHCFSQDGSHHFVCCVDIQNVENAASPHGNYNPLASVIRAASDPSSYSWCTCSEEICEQQLGGRVALNMHGIGWRGFVPP